MTAQGHPRAVFRRAIQRGNLLIAEATAREIGALWLDEALELTALIARQDPRRANRAKARWLARLLTAAEVGLDDVDLALAHLRALGTARHESSLQVLQDMAREATSGAPPRSVASRGRR